jgi:hypothetical protein
VSDQDYLYSGLELLVKYEPDVLAPEEQSAANQREPGAGFLLFGVELDGVFVPIERRKAAGILADIELAQKQRSEQTPPPAPSEPTPPEPSPPAPSEQTPPPAE